MRGMATRARLGCDHINALYKFTIITIITDNRPIIGIGRFADNRYRPIITSVSADYRLHTW